MGFHLIQLFSSRLGNNTMPTVATKACWPITLTETGLKGKYFGLYIPLFHVLLYMTKDKIKA